VKRRNRRARRRCRSATRARSARAIADAPSRGLASEAMQDLVREARKGHEHEAAAPPLPTLPATLRLGAAKPDRVGTSTARGRVLPGTSLGLRVHSRDAGRAAMGTGGEDVLVLIEDSDRAPPGVATPGSTTSRCLFPSRTALAHALKAPGPWTRTPLQGASDHAVSEAIYLRRSRRKTASSSTRTGPRRAPKWAGGGTGFRREDLDGHASARRGLATGAGRGRGAAASMPTRDSAWDTFICASEVSRTGLAFYRGRARLRV